MPGNYPRTVNDRFRRGLEDQILGEDRRLERIERIIHTQGVYWCQSFSDAQSLAASLDSYNALMGTLYPFIKGGNGHYEALHGSPPMVIYTTLDYEIEKKEIFGDFSVESCRFQSQGVEPQDWRHEEGRATFEHTHIEEDADSVAYDSAFDFQRARDEILVRRAEMFESRYEKSEPVEERFEDTLKHGRVDLDRIDDLTYKTTYDAETKIYEGLDPSSYCSAFLERMNPHNLMPNFVGFGRAFDIENEAERAEQYIDFTENHARMMEASHVSGLGFNVESMIPDVTSAVRTTELFSDPEILDTIERGNEIEVSKRLLGKIVFFEPEPQVDDCEYVAEFKTKMKKTDLAYLPPAPEEPNDSGTMFISAQTDKEFFINGGYYHERFHGKIREQHFREFADLEKHFNISSHSGLEAVVRSFEEVAADVKAFEFMGR
ncbi:MAG: hypothetical protein ABIE94_07115, partial [archaeon]